MERLDRTPRPSAAEIAKELGISRNAVYQQIQRMRRAGYLDEEFTPSGQPAREERKLVVPLGHQGRMNAEEITQLLAHVANGDDHGNVPALVLRELQDISMRVQQLNAVLTQYFLSDKSIR